ncbi:MAG: Clp protease N-terminal domain-containing protein [Phycisphaerae bacterium]|jgi:ATP-dependent Clp protease ATP-binding subunit ClpC|nr:Clp protease N-terminal domain-containing protein [Phycisphaerae bacterium]
MYERLNKGLERVIKVAHEIAREYEQEYVGTEHLLLAIAREGEGLSGQVLAEVGASEEKVRAAVDRLIKNSLEDTWVFGRLPGTPHFCNVMAKAIQETRNLGSKEVCTEHLLIGLLLERGSVGYEALKSLGLTPKLIRDKVRTLMADGAMG